MTTKKERERKEALDNIRDALKACGPDGAATLLITDVGGRPSSTGRTHYLEIHVLSNEHVGEGYGPDGMRFRPRTTLYLTINAARALGYRLNRQGQIIMGGYGYSRSREIATGLARLAGHPLYCDTLGGGIGATWGWVGQKAQAAE